MGIFVSYTGFTMESIKDKETVTSTGKVELGTPINFTLKDQSGNTHTLDDYIGKTIILHFYAIDCFSCLDELPNIEKIYNDYNQNKDDVIILGIANTSRNPKKDIINFLKKNNYTFTSLMAKNKLFIKYYITTYPNTYIINSNGNITFTSFGSLSYERLKEEIEKVRN